MLSVITEKLSCLNVLSPDQTVDDGVICMSDDVYKLGSVFVNGTRVEVEEVNHNEYQRMDLTPLTKPNLSRPIYVNRINGLNIYPNSIGSVDISYIKQPAKVDWGYVVVNDKALYNDNITVDFELHSSEESELVYRILAYAGVAIKQPDLVSTAVSLESTKVQQEKA